MTESNNHNMVHHLRFENKEIILIGTAHVSRESSDLVAAVIEAEKPDTVCVELCASRYQTIRMKDQWQNMDIVKVIKDKKTFLLLSNLILAAFQKRIAAKLDIVPGAEMIRAIEAADAMGAAVHLADREIRVTLSRAWKAMTFWEKNKLLYHLLISFTEAEDISQEDIEKMKEQDVLESLMADVGKTLPMLKRILIEERDQYLAEKIRTAPGSKIVAVVGAGHVAGIKANWDQPIDIAALETLLRPNEGLDMLAPRGEQRLRQRLRLHGRRHLGRLLGAGAALRRSADGISARTLRGNHPPAGRQRQAGARCQGDADRHKTE